MQQRQIIADEAARLLYEEGYRDYHVAKLKAIKRLGCIGNKLGQPSNKEIHQALVTRVQRYSTTNERAFLKKLREEALIAMQFLISFSPMLVGAVRDGTAGKFDPICLHLFASSTEEVIFFLVDRQIPFKEKECSLLISGKLSVQPVLSFYVDDFEIELILFIAQHPIPRCSITGKSMKRMTYQGLVDLLALPS